MGTWTYRKKMKSKKMGGLIRDKDIILEKNRVYNKETHKLLQILSRKLHIKIRQDYKKTKASINQYTTILKITNDRDTTFKQFKITVQKINNDLIKIIDIIDVKTSNTTQIIINKKDDLKFGSHADKGIKGMSFKNHKVNND